MRDLNATLSSRDWAPLFAAFAEVLEWLLDRAQLFAREYPEEVAAVERVRVFVRRRAAGEPAHARIDDLLFTLGLIAGAIEQQRQLDRAAAARARTARAELAAAHERTELAAQARDLAERTVIGPPPAMEEAAVPTHIDVEAAGPSRTDASPHPRVFARGTTRLPTKRAPRGASPAVRIRRPS